MTNGDRAFRIPVHPLQWFAQNHPGKIVELTIQNEELLQPYLSPCCSRTVASLSSKKNALLCCGSSKACPALTVVHGRKSSDAHDGIWKQPLLKLALPCTFASHSGSLWFPRCSRAFPLPFKEGIAQKQHGGREGCSDSWFGGFHSHNSAGMAVDSGWFKKVKLLEFWKFHH